MSTKIIIVEYPAPEFKGEATTSIECGSRFLASDTLAPIRYDIDSLPDLSLTNPVYEIEKSRHYINVIV